MSAIQMAPNASGTGTLSIASPNTNTNRTLTLPDATGTLVNTTDANLTTLSGAAASDIKGVNTTATVTSGTTAMTVGSGTGIVQGMWVVAQGITPGTTVSAVVGTSVTLSANAGTTLSAQPVTFYSVAKVVTPGAIGGMLCRAWANFNGTGTVAIRASFNISSLTDNGVGDFTVNFTSALADANYALAGCTNLQGSSGRSIVVFDRSDTTAKTTTACRIGTGYLDAANSGAGDGAYTSVAFFR